MMKNMNQLMKQAQAMQEKMVEIQKKLEETELQGTSGAGLVKATLRGNGTLAGLIIDPTLLDPQEKEVLEDLIVAAVNDAKAKVDAHSAQEMAQATGGLSIPGLKMPF